MAISPGGRPADDTSLNVSPKVNWVEKAGGLPKYVRMVAHALIRKGMPKEKAIPSAINRIKRWAAGLDNVRPQVQAAAAAAVAEWEAKHGANLALSSPTVDAGAMLLDLANEDELAELAALEPHDFVLDLAREYVRDVIGRFAVTTGRRDQAGKKAAGKSRDLPHDPADYPLRDLADLRKLMRAWAEVPLETRAGLRARMMTRAAQLKAGTRLSALIGGLGDGTSGHKAREGAGEALRQGNAGAWLRQHGIKLSTDDLEAFLDLAGVAGDDELDLATPADLEVIDLAPGDYRPPYDWKHGFIPLTPAAAASKAKMPPWSGKGRTKTPRGVHVAGVGKIKPGQPSATPKAPQAGDRVSWNVRRGGQDVVQHGTVTRPTQRKSGGSFAVVRPDGSDREVEVRHANLTTSSKPAGKPVGELSDPALATELNRLHFSTNTANVGRYVELTNERNARLRAGKWSGAKPKAEPRDLEVGPDGKPRAKGAGDALAKARDDEARGRAVPGAVQAAEKAAGDPRLKMSAARASDALHRGDKPTHTERAETTTQVQRVIDKARADGKSYIIVEKGGKPVGINLETGVLTPYGRRDAIANADREKAGGIVDLNGAVVKGGPSFAEQHAASGPKGPRRITAAERRQHAEKRRGDAYETASMTLEQLKARDEQQRIEAGRPESMRQSDDELLKWQREVRATLPPAEQEETAQKAAAGKPRAKTPGGGSYPTKADGTPDYGAMSAEQAATIRAQQAGRGVGARVDTDRGPGTVKSVSTRGTTIEPDAPGEGPFHVAAGTPGHDRIVPASRPTGPRRVQSTTPDRKLSGDRALVNGEQLERVEGPDGRLVWRGSGNRDVTEPDVIEKANRLAPLTGSPLRAQQRNRPENRQATVSGRPGGGAIPTDAQMEERRQRTLEAAGRNPDGSVKTSTSSTNPDAAIRVEHTPDGTLVHGTTRDDRETIDALKGQGFKWSRNLDAWYLPRTWGQDTRERRVKALESQLGDKLGVDRTSGPRMSAAERDAQKRERAAGRAERLDSRAQRQSAEAARRFEASDLREEKSGIPFGQPILVGHHSEKRHRRALDRAHANLGKGVEAQREAERAQEAADRARRVAAGSESKVTIGNRIQKNEAALRDVERKLNGSSSQLRGPATGNYRERLLARKADLEDTIQHDKGKLEAAGGVPSKDTVGKGDFVKTRFGWYPVQKVNAKSVTVPSTMIPGRTETIPFHKIDEHRAGGDVSREDVARMIQGTSQAFPNLRTELAKSAPAGDVGKPDAPSMDALLEKARSLPAGPERDRIDAQLRERGVSPATVRQGAAERAAANAPADPTKGTGRFMSPETARGITADTARKMTDDQLERAMQRLMQDGTYSGPAFKVLEDELNRRDAARAEGNRRGR